MMGKNKISAERTQCPAVHRTTDAQNRPKGQFNQFNRNTLPLFFSLSGYLFLNYSALTSRAHRRYGRGAKIKVPLTHRRPSHPSLRHSNPSFGSLIATSGLYEIEVFCLFSLRCGSAGSDLDLRPLTGKLSTRKDPHCYFKLRRCAVDLLSAPSSPLEPAFMFSVLF